MKQNKYLLTTRNYRSPRHAVGSAPSPRAPLITRDPQPRGGRSGGLRAAAAVTAAPNGPARPWGLPPPRFRRSPPAGRARRAKRGEGRRRAGRSRRRARTPWPRAKVGPQHGPLGAVSPQGWSRPGPGSLCLNAGLSRF